MNRTAQTFFLVMLLIAAAVAIKHLTPPETPPATLSKEAVILAFGDSLTYGTGAEKGESYPERLEERIGRRVINAGVPGELSGEGLKRLSPLLERHRPDLLLLCHGGNDILKKTEEAILRKNLEGMVRLALSRKIDVVLIAMPQFSLLRLAPHPVYGEIAKAHALAIENDILSELLGDARYKSDQIHPNGAGYEKMAEAIEKIVREKYKVEE